MPCSRFSLPPGDAAGRPGRNELHPAALVSLSSRQPKYLFASPLAAWTRRPGLRAGFVLPFFWYRSDTLQVRGVPLLYLDHTFQGTGQRTRMFGPYVMVDSPSVTARVFFPFYARYWEPGDTGTYVFPLYFGRRGDNGYRLDSFLPFFWSSHDQDHRTLVVGPWFRAENSRKHSHASGLIPLFVSADSPSAVCW